MQIGTLATRTLGKTGLTATLLGFGSAELGYSEISPQTEGAFLNKMLDLGINLIDTAECYGDAEEIIGHTLSTRRNEFILVTKCGHRVGDDDPAEWTADLVRESIARSLRRLKTDHLDILHFHSCSREKLRDDNLMDALVACKRNGQTRFIGYSGDGDDAGYAVGMGIFDVLETSVNMADQQALSTYLPLAVASGMGVTAKRSIANACWRDLSQMSSFYAGYARPYADRLKKLAVTPDNLGFDGSWVEMALRFTVFQPQVHCAIVGGTNLEHLKDDIKFIEKGPLPDEMAQKIRSAWLRNDDGSWKGQI